jgi:predicted DCC family thiol-disulfide oxidoreductase YuxK
LEVIYDGQCPFCSAYVNLVRIRENFDVELLDARQRPDIARQCNELGYNLAEGMIVRFEDKVYFGSEALTVMSVFSSKSGIWNRIIALCFKNRSVSSVVYPLLKLGRNMTLALLGRSREF